MAGLFFRDRNVFHVTVSSYWIFAHGNFGLLSLGESQLRQSRAIHLAVHAACFSVSLSQGTLTWTTGSLTSAEMLEHATAHGDVCTP